MAKPKPPKKKIVAGAPDKSPMSTNTFLGMAAPYLAIFNDLGEPIMNPLVNPPIPLGAFVVGFEYTHKEGDSNEGRITVDSGNPDIVDIEEIQPEKNLMVQWGYIYPDGTTKSTPAITCMVKDLDTQFDAKGVRLVIHLTDATKNLNASAPVPHCAIEDRYSRGLARMLEEGIEGQFGVAIIKYK